MNLSTCALAGAIFDFQESLSFVKILIATTEPKSDESDSVLNISTADIRQNIYCIHLMAIDVHRSWDLQ